MLETESIFLLMMHCRSRWSLNEALDDWGDQKMMLIKIFHLLGQWSIAFVPKMKLDCVLCNTGVLVQRTIIITTSINVKMNFF